MPRSGSRQTLRSSGAGGTETHHHAASKKAKKNKKKEGRKRSDSDEKRRAARRFLRLSDPTNPDLQSDSEGSEEGDHTLTNPPANPNYVPVAQDNVEMVVLATDDNRV